MEKEVRREELVMARYREMYAGPALDALVAAKVMGSAEVKPYSTDEDYTAEVFAEMNARGYAFEFGEDDGVTCELRRDGKTAALVWGLTYEEAVCRAALKLMGSDPA